MAIFKAKLTTIYVAISISRHPFASNLCTNPPPVGIIASSFCPKIEESWEGESPAQQIQINRVIYTKKKNDKWRDHVTITYSLYSR